MKYYLFNPNASSTQPGELSLVGAFSTEISALLEYNPETDKLGNQPGPWYLICNHTDGRINYVQKLSPASVRFHRRVKR